MALGLSNVTYGRRKNWKNGNIFPGAVIPAVPQDLKFGGEESLAIIGDNCTKRMCDHQQRNNSIRSNRYWRQLPYHG
jgi:acyl-[acyl carrier protein]--UDP-N-acetylglucosamine O-acyltransferase